MAGISTVLLDPVCSLKKSDTDYSICRGCVLLCTYICMYLCIIVCDGSTAMYVCMYSASDCSQDSMCHMTQLRELDLKNNRLSVLPGTYVRTYALIESIHVSIM